MTLESPGSEVEMRLEVFGEVLSQLIDPKDIHALPQNQSMIIIFFIASMYMI